MIIGVSVLITGAAGAVISWRAGTVPAERVISLGFEDVVTSSERLDQLARRLDQVGATGISLGVGRPDWTAFPWPELPEAESARVRATGRDFTQEAIDRLRTGSDGRTRTVTLTVDALAPRWIAQRPELAGVRLDGSSSEEFVGLTALTSGPAGDRLVAMVELLADRYRPDAVSFTELMFDDATFGPADLASYRAASGAVDWPRDGSGQVDPADASIAAWRSDALADLVGRAREQVAGTGVRMEVDVRAAWTDPAGDRAESGHDYDRLLRSADRLVVWNYFGLSDRPASYSADLAHATRQRAPGRFVISVGLWARDETIISPRETRVALQALTRGGAGAVSVTPASRMTDAHWAAVQRAWR